MEYGDLVKKLEELEGRLTKLEYKGAKKKESFVVKGQAGEVGMLRDAFLEAYRLEFKRDYPAWGAKENGQAKNWLRSITVHRAMELARLYPKWNDTWVTSQGHPFGILVTQFVKLDAWALSKDVMIRKMAADMAEKNNVKRRVEEGATAHGILRKVQQGGGPNIGYQQRKGEIPNSPKERISGESHGTSDDEVFSEGDPFDIR